MRLLFAAGVAVALAFVVLAAPNRLAVVTGASASACQPLGAPSGNVVTVGSVSALVNAVNNAAAGTTIQELCGSAHREQPAACGGGHR